MSGRVFTQIYPLHSTISDRLVFLSFVIAMQQQLARYIQCFCSVIHCSVISEKSAQRGGGSFFFFLLDMFYFSFFIFFKPSFPAPFLPSSCNPEGWRLECVSNNSLSSRHLSEQEQGREASGRTRKKKAKVQRKRRKQEIETNERVGNGLGSWSKLW